MSTIESPPAGVCRLTGRIVTATGKPRTGAALSFTPVPALPAHGELDGRALIAAAKVSVNKDGMLTSVNPDTGQVVPWVDVLTGDWETCLRVTGAGEPWSLITHLPSGEVTDIADLRGVIVIPPGSDAEKAMKDIQATISDLQRDLRALGTVSNNALTKTESFAGFQVIGPDHGMGEISVEPGTYVTYNQQVENIKSGLEQLAGWVNELHNDTTPAIQNELTALTQRVASVETKPGTPGPAGPAGPPGPQGPAGPAGSIRSTGWTKLTGLPGGLIAGGSDNGIWLNRVGDSVYMAIRGANNKTPVIGFSVPAGYRHAVQARAAGQLIPGDNPVIAGKVQFINGGTFEWKGVASAELGYGVFAYPTSDPWPES